MDSKALLDKLDKLSELLCVNRASRHWWYQRMTAVALVPLSFWLIILLDKALNAPYADTLAWLSSPLNAIVILAWTLAVIYHAALGVQVVLEDYVSTIAIREKSIWATNLIFIVLGLAALLAIFRILLIG